MEEKKEQEIVTIDLLKNYLDSFGIGKGLSENERNQFITIAQAYQLNPFKREIYCIAYGQGNGRRLSIITGYETYLKRASRIGVLDGWEVKTTGNKKDGNLEAIITIHRKDWSHPFIHSVVFEEYNQNNNIWNSKPITMIKKVVTAQAFRLCFPDEFGGMPYTSDELPDEMTQEKNVTPKTDDERQSIMNEITEIATKQNEEIKGRLRNIIRVTKTKESLRELLDQLKSGWLPSIEPMPSNVNIIDSLNKATQELDNELST